MESKHYFAAANTGAGFYSCFDNINDPGRKGFLYILKGGPGTGKSTLMKNIGRHFEASGEAVEYFHCSSDEGSLDGVRLARVNAAVIDGTAPHAVDPVMPGIADAIINLGEFIGSGVKEHCGEIRDLVALKKECFETAYAYIGAAAALDSANQAVLARVTDGGAVKNALKGLLRRLETGIQEDGGAPCFDGAHLPMPCIPQELFSPYIHPPAQGRERRLFISAIAGESKINYRSANKYNKVISLAGNDCAAQAILCGIAAEMARKGRCFTSFCDILSPGRREAVETGGGTLIAVNAPEGGTEIRLEDTLVKGKYNVYEDAVLYGRESIGKILKIAAKALSEARAAHGGIEKYYVKAMDFGALDRVTEKLTEALKALYR